MLLCGSFLCAARATPGESLAEGAVDGERIDSPVERDPPLPAPPACPGPPDEALRCGDPPGAVRVALVDSGVNYTLPSIARALAREPDGTLVGHDFWDLDARPFDRHPAAGGRLVRHGTRTASVLLAEAPAARLVPYRYPRPDMTRMGDLVAHAARHGVRVVGLPLGGGRREPWDAFEAAARAHPHILFVASAGNNGRDIDRSPVWPAALPLANLVTVTSADDHGALAERANFGRASVDYLVPAENVPVTRFDGSEGRASGSSYAVPRLVALAARLVAEDPARGAPELVAELRRRFADGSRPRVAGEGFIVDPLAVGEPPPRVVAERALPIGRTETGSGAVVTGAGDAAGGEPAGNAIVAPPADLPPLDVALDLLLPNAAWPLPRVERSVAEAARILAPCAIRLAPLRLREIAAPARLADLQLGASKTLFDAVRESGPERRLTVVFARDTRMADPYDGEAFGRANTRERPWLADSVWLTRAIDDAGIALAHELFHVLANSGAHDTRAGNLMLARTTGDNTTLAPEQCATARRTALRAGLARRRH